MILPKGGTPKNFCFSLIQEVLNQSEMSFRMTDKFYLKGTSIGLSWSDFLTMLLGTEKA